ncbi:ligand-binding sensor domain-containing protein [Flavobacterium sp. 25HG05S-40]|uniref:ligand-binding sensor domain-containing protein n=1 Tax=Flavobacterium sp. 25HG05S-40 TaxID=3458682 RepID=UPI00404508F4
MSLGTMKKQFSQMPVFTLLTILLLGIACNGPVRKELPKEKDHPKLVKNIGDPRSGNVNCGLQDKEGNLWFGTTENGLYKYDGKSFRQFTVNNGLNNNEVSCLLQDRDGRIWIGTKAGLCLYDPSTSLRTGGTTFTEIKIPVPKNLPPNKNPYFQNHWVYTMMQANSGKLWFATIDGVYVFDGKSLPTEQVGFTHFPINEAANGFLSSNDKVERIFEDKEGTIWFGGRTNEGVFRYDGQSISNLKLMDLFQDGPKPKAHNWGWPQWQDKNGNIWFSNWGGAYRYDGKTVTSFTTKEGLPSEVTRIIEDKKGLLWFGCSDGLRRYDGTTFTHYKEGLINPWIWEILEDKNGNLWVGTRGTGLYLFDGKTFIPYSEYKQ